MWELVAIYGRRKERRQLEGRQPLSYLKAAQILGAILGEKIFTNHKAGRLSRSTMVEWLKESLNPADFDSFYYQRLKEIDNIELGDIDVRQ